MRTRRLTPSKIFHCATWVTEHGFLFIVPLFQEAMQNPSFGKSLALVEMVGERSLYVTVSTKLFGSLSWTVYSWFWFASKSSVRALLPKELLQSRQVVDNTVHGVLSLYFCNCLSRFQNTVTFYHQNE